jgi:hypothetical protein
MKVTHQLVGYDPGTERLAFKKEIPEEIFAKLTFIEPDDDDPEMFDAYPLDATQVHKIMSFLHADERRRLDFFIEGIQSEEDFLRARR